MKVTRMYLRLLLDEDQYEGMVYVLSADTGRLNLEWRQRWCMVCGIPYYLCDCFDQITEDGDITEGYPIMELVD